MRFFSGSRAFFSRAAGGEGNELTNVFVARKQFGCERTVEIGRRTGETRPGWFNGNGDYFRLDIARYFQNS